jgi:quercetin dioxygenase-like cupin family protein
MNKKLLTLPISLFTLHLLWAQPEVSIDPVQASPDNYTVLQENEFVRVLKYTIKPGKKDNPHTHPAQAFYVLSGGKLRIYRENAATIDVEEETGSSTWSAGSSKHYVENIGKTTFIALLTEIKQAHSATSNDEQKVQQTITNVFNALSDRDAASLKNYCTADVRFYEYGQTWTIDTLINRAITKNVAPDFKRTNRFEFVNTTIQGNTAWGTYNLYSEVTSNEKTAALQWLETVVMIREENKWRLKVLHSTLIKKS